jgi:acyl-coenzyme A thioesterase PaaI-like protein
MNVKTHIDANYSLVGKPLTVKDNEESTAELTAKEEMIVDSRGLIHGGFTFGLADYAVMIAVNHPNVVLGSAQVRFLAPVKVGDRMVAKARVMECEGSRRKAEVEVYVRDAKVFTGTMICYVLERHVLDR